MRLRLAFGLGRTLAELENTLGHDEWIQWVAFHALYDLPDGFLVTGRLGALVSQVAGGKGNAAAFAPYFSPSSRIGNQSDLKPAFAFLKAHAPEKRRKPI